MAVLQKTVDLVINFLETADVSMVVDKTLAIVSAMHCTPTTAAVRPNHKKSNGNIGKKSLHRRGVKPCKSQTCEKFLSPHN
jgi:hypothetical protein